MAFWVEIRFYCPFVLILHIFFRISPAFGSQGLFLTQSRYKWISFLVGASGSVALVKWIFTQKQKLSVAYFVCCIEYLTVSHKAFAYKRLDHDQIN